MMTGSEIERAIGIASRLRLRHPLFGSGTIEWRTSPGGRFVLEASARVPDRACEPSTIYRNDARQIPVRASREIEVPYFMSDAEAEDLLARMARELLLEVAAHEIDEMLELRGRRVREPHREREP